MFYRKCATLGRFHTSGEIYGILMSSRIFGVRKISKFVVLHINDSFKSIIQDFMFSTKLCILRRISDKWGEFYEFLWSSKLFGVRKILKIAKISNFWLFWAILLFLHVKCSFKCIKYCFIFSTKMRILRQISKFKRILWILVSSKSFGVTYEKITKFVFLHVNCSFKGIK